MGSLPARGPDPVRRPGRDLENARQRERYASDPEYRARMNARQSERRRKRYASDPEYRARLLEWRRAYRKKGIRYLDYYPKSPGFGPGKCWQCGGDMWLTSAPPLIPAPRRGSKYCSRACAGVAARRINRLRCRRRYNNPVERKKILARSRYRYRWVREYRKRLIALTIRQAGRCAICSRPLPQDASQVHVDHRIPVSAGGTSDLSNLQAVCAKCNLSKGSRLDNLPDTGDET